MKPIIKIPLVCLLLISLAAMFIAAKSSGRVHIRFEDDFIGPARTLAGHAPDGAGFEQWNYRKLNIGGSSANVSGGLVEFWGNGTPSNPDQSPYYEINNEHEEPAVFAGNFLIETYLEVAKSNAPGIAGATFWEYQFPDANGVGISRITMTRDGTGQLRMAGIFDDSKSWVFDVADHDGKGQLFIFRSRSGQFKAAWKSQQDSPLAFAPSGRSTIKEPVIRIIAGGGGDLLSGPDVVVDVIWITDQKLKRKGGQEFN